VSTDTGTCGCHFLVPGRTFMTHINALSNWYWNYWHNSATMSNIVLLTTCCCCYCCCIRACVCGGCGTHVWTRFDILLNSVFLCKFYVKCGSTRNYWRNFIVNFLTSVPSTTATHELKARSTGSVLDKIQGHHFQHLLQNKWVYFIVFIEW
jgi:hypothetical protein